VLQEGNMTQYLLAFVLFVLALPTPAPPSAPPSNDNDGWNANDGGGNSRKR